jgi:hypothetical protein
VADGVLPRWTRNSGGASPAKAAGRIMNNGVVMDTIRAEVAVDVPRVTAAKGVRPVAAADPPTPAAVGIPRAAAAGAVQPITLLPAGAKLIRAVPPHHIAAARIRVNTGMHKVSSPAVAAVPVMAAEANPITTIKITDL